MNSYSWNSAITLWGNSTALRRDPYGEVPAANLPLVGTNPPVLVDTLHLPWHKQKWAVSLNPAQIEDPEKSKCFLSSVTKLGLSALPLCLVSTVKVCLPSLPLGLLMGTQPEETAHTPWRDSSYLHQWDGVRDFPLPHVPAGGLLSLRTTHHLSPSQHPCGDLDWKLHSQGWLLDVGMTCGFCWSYFPFLSSLWLFINLMHWLRKLNAASGSWLPCQVLLLLLNIYSLNSGQPSLKLLLSGSETCLDTI